MNRGDFGAVYLPKSLKIVAGSTYQVVNQAGFSLGCVSGAIPVGLTFAIPKPLMTQLTNEGLVSATSIDLYDDASNPTASAANMTRYLAILQQLAPAAVSD